MTGLRGVMLVPGSYLCCWCKELYRFWGTARSRSHHVVLPSFIMQILLRIHHHTRPSSGYSGINGHVEDSLPLTDVRTMCGRAVVWCQTLLGTSVVRVSCARMDVVVWVEEASDRCLFPLEMKLFSGLRVWSGLVGAGRLVVADISLAMLLKASQ